MICPCSTFVSFLIHMGFTSHRSEWYFVAIKGSVEMCICQNVASGIRLLNQIDHDLGLREQSIPKVRWKVVGYTGQDAEEIGFDVVYGYLGCVALVASWRHQFHVKFARVADVILYLSDTSLLRTYFLGTMPARFSWSMSALYARIILASLQFFMGSTRMVLLSISTITMMYLLPQRDWVGNLPVWLKNIVLHTMYVWVYKSRIFLPWRWKVSHVSNGTAFALVDQTFFLVWFRAPLQF